jgi:hypothetical protein
VNDQAKEPDRPERPEPVNDTDYEALALPAEIDSTEAAALTAYKVARTLER